jgi:hypothetical protein
MSAHDASGAFIAASRSPGPSRSTIVNVVGVEPLACSCAASRHGPAWPTDYFRQCLLLATSDTRMLK